MVDAAWLSTSRNVAVEAPAGTGKTTLISSAVGLPGNGCQLVLTHTHAGVGAILRALREKGVPGSRYHVDTIASWSFRYARAYPAISGLTIDEPKKGDWEGVYCCALKALQSKAIRAVVQESYDGLYVDEYQDCTIGQHALIVALAGILPCRVLGDPLQGIFEFVKTGILDWNRDVGGAFELHMGSETPWRWQRHNPELGAWLTKVRAALLRNEPIDLREGPITWTQLNGSDSRKSQIQATKFLRTREGETVIAIDKWAAGVNKIAGALGGTYSSIEPIECKELFKFASEIQKKVGLDRAVAVIDFASQCMTKVGTLLSPIRKQMVVGNIPSSRKFARELKALLDVANSAEFKPVLNALEVLRDLSGVVLYRRELFHELKRALANHEPEEELAKSAWRVRNVTRQSGRRLAVRSVGTTLLVKGLEFDHAVVIDGESVGHTREHLYVALTRGSKSLTVLSRSPILPPATP